MKKRLFKERDICSSNYEVRIIIHITEDCYYFANFDKNMGGIFYNPTKSAFGHKVMEQKYKKVGELSKKSYDELCKGIGEATSLFNQGFARIQEINNKVDITKFIKV